MIFWIVYWIVFEFMLLNGFQPKILILEKKRLKQKKISPLLTRFRESSPIPIAIGTLQRRGRRKYGF